MTKYLSRYGIGFLLLYTAFIFLPGGCEKQESGLPQARFSNKLIELPISGKLSRPEAEISGLCWIDDQLILLPQYPHRFAREGAGAVFYLSGQAIKDYLAGRRTVVLEPRRISFDDREIASQIPGFQGYEAIAHIKNRVFLTIESLSENGMQAHLVQGTLSEDWQKIILDPASRQSLDLPAQVRNMSYETLVVAGEKLLVIYELNGLNINRQAVALMIDPLTGETQKLNFPQVEYRITDATAMDENGNFWALNYYWPGEYQKIKPAEDLLPGADEGFLFDKDKSVERLVEFHFSGSTIILSKRKPVYLEPDQSGEGRNWEGVVRYHDRGFIIVTDKHPRTILAFAGIGSALNK